MNVDSSSNHLVFEEFDGYLLRSLLRLMWDYWRNIWEAGGFKTIYHFS